MSVPLLRRHLRQLSDTEWEQILAAMPAFHVSVSSEGKGSRSGGHRTSVESVKRWVLVPSKSDDRLSSVVWLCASMTLLPDDEGERPKDPPPLPEDTEAQRRWLSTVAATKGRGPAKVCLLAAREDGPGDGPAATTFDELLMMIENTPVEERPTAEPDQPDLGTDESTAAAESDLEPRQSSNQGTEDTNNEDLAATRQALEAVSSRASTLASTLTEAAEQLVLGASIPDDLPSDIAGFLTARTNVLQDVASVTGRDLPGDFDECSFALDAEAASRAKEKEAKGKEALRVQHAHDLRGQIAELVELIGRADAAVIPHLQAALGACQDELRQLESAALAVEEHGGAVEPIGGAGSPLESEDAGSSAAGVQSDSGPQTDFSASQHANTETDIDPVGAEALDHDPAEQDEPRVESGPQPESPAPEKDADQASGTATATATAPAAALVVELDRAVQSGQHVPDAEEHARQVEVLDDASAGSENTIPEGLTVLIARRRPVAAAWLAESVDPGGILARALRFNGVAYACGRGAISPADAVLYGTDLPLDELAQQRAAATIAICGAARSGLAAGWAHRPLLDSLVPVLHLDHSWQAFLDAVSEATHQGYVHAGVASRDSSGGSREEAAGRAEALRLELEAASTKYLRATLVLKRLLRHDEPLGAALEAVVRWSAGQDSALTDIRRLAGDFRSDKDRERLIDAADQRVSTPQQRRKGIIAAARRQLESRIEQVADLLSSCLDLAAPTPTALSDERVQQRLVNTAQDLAEPQMVSQFEGAVLMELRRWVLEPTSGPERGSSPQDLIWRASLPLTDVRRDDVGLPLPDELDPAAVERALLSRQSPRQLVDAYLRSGNLVAAQSAADGDKGLLERVDAALGGWEQRLAAQVRQVENELARARAEHKMDAVEVSGAEGLLVSVKGYEGDRFDVQMGVLEEILRRLETSLEEEAGRLRYELSTLERPQDDPDMVRVSALIESGDLATAREYLYQLRRGEALPPAQVEGPSPLESFNEAVKSISGVDLTAGTMFDHFSKGREPTRIAREGLAAWTQLIANPLRQSRDQLPRVLRLLGLELESMKIDDITERGSGDSKVFEVRAQPLDGSIVPGLGSRAARQYFVTVAGKKRTDPVQVLQLIPQTRHRLANLILVPTYLTQQQRRIYLRLARERNITALVVDASSLGYVAATASGSFRALQEITLPYAAFSHYTPYVAGDVPEEVFVGRTDESQQIIDPSGSLFVYGGRQLGKSALLRHIAATQSDGRGRQAIYVDLKAKMIGEAQDPAHLWVVLLEEFQRAGIIGRKVTTGTAKVVTEHTRNWLLEDETRRLLLLLDEADLFLESEARQRREGNRVVRFANVSPLKDLMESTNRRFKPVFAGLHQVQRFHEISNTPLAHGGSDILVGPLDRKSALDLVEKPLSALGFKFENRDLISRLLAFTNYQASLVQIVCDKLALQMSALVPGPDQPPVVIRATDVDRVIEDREVRRLLAERLRLTIALEDRYLVIALVVAVLSLEEDFTQAYEPTEILSWCRAHWPGGFADMTSKEFGLYLEEMEGLGVLVRRPDGFVSVRSPNVVAMLGTKTDLEQQLTDGADRFELPHDYNPRVSRRTIRRGSTEIRSPLTEQDLQVLLPKSRVTSGVSLIVGSPALGIDDVVDVLQDVARERDWPVTVIRASGFGSWVTDSGDPASRGRTDVPVVDAMPMSTPELEALLEQARRTVDRRKGQPIVVVAGPSAADLVQVWEPRLATLTVLERWNDEGLRSWADGPFGPAEHRERTFAVTSGWPRLVDEVARRSVRGEPLQAIVDTVGSGLNDPTSAADFVRDVGVEPDVGLLQRWADVAGPGDGIDPADLDSLFGDDPQVPEAAFQRLTQRLRVLGVVTGGVTTARLDPVVHRALANLGSATDLETNA